MKINRLILSVLTLVVINGCSEYSRVLKSNDIDLKFNKAKEYYQSGQCFKAVPILEELIGVTRGTDRAEEVYYYYAFSHYCVKDYYLANYYFKSFTKMFALSRYSEECQFMAAICSSKLSPEYSLDQADTHNAINEFQLFMDRYPDSPRRDTANIIIADLNAKLELKDFEVAKLYVKTEKYKAGVNALKQMLKDYPNSRYKEEILFLTVKAGYLLANNSIAEKQPERYRATIESYLTFAAAFPAGKDLREAENYYEKSRKQLENFKDQANR